MINIKQAPTEISVLQFTFSELKNIDGARVCAIFPNQRSLREAIYNNFETVELFSISEFTRYANLSLGVNVPKTLRPFYLKIAIEKLSSEERITIFKNENNIYLENFLSFIEVSSSILLFYRELAAEMISTDYLLNAGKYSDHEDQIKILDKLWKLYIKILNENGYVDEWEGFKDPKINHDFIDRYDKFIFLIGGYLTKYELNQLQKVGENKDVTLIFTYVGEKHRHHYAYEKELGVELNNIPLPKFNENSLAIYSSTSVLGQVELISKYIIHLNETNNISFSDMAVIIPNENIKAYFLRADKYNLFDISSNEDIEAFFTFQIAESSIDIINDIKKSQFMHIEIEKVIDILSHTFIKNHFDASSTIEKLYSKLDFGDIYIKYGELIKLPFFSESFLDFSNIADKLTISEYVKHFIRFVKSFEKFLADKQLVALRKIVLELESYLALYGKIDNKLEFSAIASFIMKDVSKLRVQTPKGKVAVVGILESRNLDFEALFIPELNETIFPPINQKDLYLNTEIRLELDMPTFIDRENLMKNYLLQIMSHSKINILTYSDNPNKRRRSRFIEELIINNNIIVKKYAPKSFDIFATDDKWFSSRFDLAIEKNDEIMKAINNFTLSATSFNEYISCKLKFYFSRVLKQKSAPEAELNLSAATLGSAFHKALETIAKLNIIDIKKFSTELEKLFFTELEGRDAYKFNLAQKFIAKEAAKAIPEIAKVNFDRLNNGWRIYQTENSIETKFMGLNLKGYIDRVDKNGDRYEIIDYKYKSLNKVSEKIDFNKQTDLQTPFYAFLFEQKEKVVVDNLYYFDLKRTFNLQPSFYMKNYNQFKEFLEETISDIQNTNSLFTKTDKLKVCQYCQFANICGRS